MPKQELRRAILLGPPWVSRRLLFGFEASRFSFQKLGIALVYRATFLPKLAGLPPVGRWARCTRYVCRVEKLAGWLVIDTLFLIQLLPDTLHVGIGNQS